MQNRSLRILMLLLMLISTVAYFSAVAQNFGTPPSPSIKVLARSYGDSIVLRWAPDDAAAWSVANAYGYQVSRSYVNKDSVRITEILTEFPLLPLSLEQMKSVFGPGDTLAAIAAQALYGKEMQSLPEPAPKTNPGQGIMQQYERQQTRFAFAMQAAEFSQPVATALGLRYVDKRAKPGILYDYTVSSLVPAEIVKLLPGSVLLQNLPATALQAPSDPDIRQSAPYRAELIWERDRYTAYFIERSEDLGKTYIRINHRPWFSTLPEAGTPGLTGDAAMYTALLKDYHLFTDSVVPGKTYHYRVLGLNSFGELSPPSVPVRITPEDLLFPPAPALNPLEKNGDLSIITWLYPSQTNDLKGFSVQKAENQEGPWQTLHDGLLPKDSRSFTDTRRNTTSVYYRVAAIDQAGNRSNSFAARCIAEDTLAPAVPGGLAGIIYREGIVELFWNAVPDKDIKGYRVLYANQSDHEFTVLTPKPLKDAYFRDSINLNTLTRSIFYKVIAEDRSGNQSAASGMLKLNRPDVVPPAKVVVLGSSQEEEKISITWSLSASEDVSEYRVYRKPASETEWQVVQTLKPGQLSEKISFTDTPPPSKAMIEYSINVVDSAGNSSGLSKPLAFKVKGKAPADISLSLEAAYDKQKQVVRLSWSGEAKEAFYYQLLRAEGKEEPAVFTSLESAEKSYTDSRIKAGTTYVYAVRIAFKDGRKSAMSKRVTVVVK